MPTLGKRSPDGLIQQRIDRMDRADPTTEDRELLELFGITGHV